MRLLVLTLLLFSRMAIAQEQPVVRVDVSPQEVTVGQPVRVRVTVLVPTWFPKPPVFPSFELANAITRLPPDSSYPTSERRGGATWSGIIRNYQVYPLASATYVIDNASMTVTYADPGAAPIVADVAVPEIRFQGVVPAGAESLDPYVAGTRLEIRREIGGDIESLGAGDALVVRHITELDGLPAIFLPPLGDIPEVPGVSVYADAPIVEDNGQARRTETMTLVFDAGGEFVLPALTLDWWNMETGRIENTAIPELTFSVSGPPPVTIVTTVESRDWRHIVTVAAGVVAVLLLLSWLASRAHRAWRERMDSYHSSEEYAFRRVQQSARRNDARSLYVELNRWLDRVQPGLGPREFAKRYGDETLQSLVDELVQSLYAGGGERVDSRALSRHLAGARTRALGRNERVTGDRLPTLNPVGS